MIPFSFQKSNKGDECEDALPIADERYSIVCDGVGASGLTKHCLNDKKTGTQVRHTSAYLGSRIVCNSVNDYYNYNLEEFNRTLLNCDSVKEVIEKFVNGLKNYVIESLNRKMMEWNITPSNSKTFKDLPTTLASTVYISNGNKTSVLVIWAGDSRAYVLSRENGLQLLSLDDAVDSENKMNSDSQMTNVILYGDEFKLNYALYEVTSPCLIFCCSDGCFDFRKSPLHFEYALLYTIINCKSGNSENNIGEILAENILDVMCREIGDDTTMAGVIVGMSSIDDLKNTYQPRMKEFESTVEKINTYINDLNEYKRESDEKNKTIRLYASEFETLVYNLVTSLMNLDSSLDEYTWLASVKDYNKYKEKIESASRRDYTEETYGDDKARKLCMDFLVADYLKNKYSQRMRSYKDSNCDIISAGKYLSMCAEMLQHPSFKKNVKLQNNYDAESELNINFIVSILIELSELLNSGDPIISDLWEQSKYLSPIWRDERNKYLADGSLTHRFEQVIDGHAIQPFVSSLTDKELIEYRKGIQEKSQKQQVPDKSAREIIDEFWMKNKEEIIDNFIAYNGDIYSNKYETELYNLEHIRLYKEANQNLPSISKKIEDAQSNVNSVWDSYKDLYQLYTKASLKGVL